MGPAAAVRAPTHHPSPDRSHVSLQGLFSGQLWGAKHTVSPTMYRAVRPIPLPRSARVPRAATGHSAPPQALARREELQRMYATYFGTHRVAALLVPSTPCPARPIRDGKWVELCGKQVALCYLRRKDGEKERMWWK